MTDHSLLTEELVATQIAERARRAQHHRVPGLRRPRRRHALALRLHRVADLLDA